MNDPVFIPPPGVTGAVAVRDATGTQLQLRAPQDLVPGFYELVQDETGMRLEPLTTFNGAVHGGYDG
jgi:hypothetical protein